jgi:hypothetical protein
MALVKFQQGVAIAIGQKTTLSESGIGLPQWAETLGVEFSLANGRIDPVERSQDEVAPSSHKERLGRAIVPPHGLI